MARNKILSTPIYELVKAEFERWERMEIRDERVDEPARVVFWAIGILSWYGLELYKYLDAAGEMLKAMSEIERTLPEVKDDFFVNKVYPTFLRACEIALAKLSEWFLDKEIGGS